VGGLVGAKLRRLRQASGRSLRELARAASYSPSQLSRIERELAPPPSPRHRLYTVIGQFVGAAARDELIAAARAERSCLLEGVPWRLARR
jgi:transcriptional regulator with XRE-family HTH domain